MDGAEYWYVPSLSYKTIVYKGMLLTGQLAEYFPDLQDPAMETALALVHSRFSTNTFPELGPRASVPLHRAQRRDQHPARQHQLDACPRGAVRVRPVRRRHEEDPARSSIPNGSDSAMFDNALELLVLAGRSLPHAMMMMIPEPWSNHETHGRRQRGVLRVPLLPDGAVGRPGLDRLHRRPEDRRRARPQRPAPVALLRDQGRPGHHGLRGRRARHAARGRR